MDFRDSVLTGEQIRAGRAIARLEQAELARVSGVSLKTIKRLESMCGHVEANTRTVMAISDAFRELGVGFDLRFGDGPGVRLLRDPAIAAEREVA